ncbi:MAG TPA: D-alanyl-D-alanine carboxypeptidase/D-alanyl-D-alanine-endopeptidase [Chitinophagaceae bacterium]|nr:D-alanyl-D-alanine carboxypeptidase/D-alanyl-D-alanine-endopeptidase [Chitinophagaceae bacterium]
MRKILITFHFSFLTFNFFGQSVTQKLQKAFTAFEKDSQMKHAISSLYVIDAKTGQVVFDKNSQIGLAPASTQKIITSVTAFELLGKDYRYKTEFGIINKESSSILCVKPSGDPTLGSWRWQSTKEQEVLKRVISSIRKTDLKNSEAVLIYAQGWNSEQIPDAWIWQDLGNYYGSGAGILNWRENQFDLVLKSGKSIGDRVEIVLLDPQLYSYQINSLATSAATGTGDNAYIYLPLDPSQAYIRGTIPVNESRFIISGAMVNPANQFIETLADSLKDRFKQPRYLSSVFLNESLNKDVKIIHTEFSPALDSIIYWFNKKSINLYGEALVKTIAYEKKGSGSTDSGVVIVQNFWKEKGLDEDELGIVDGSGLSPLNRVTTHSQVEILKYAKTKDWFPYFYNSLPEYNGMSMKSGTIRGVKGFCGYQKAKNGKEYIFSFLVNNYNGSSSSLVNKMYKVLDILK